MFLYLLFAHFIADYPLQTDWVVKNKQRLEILLLHVGTHFVVMLAVTAPHTLRLWPYLAVLTGVHFFIDVWKNWMYKVRPAWVVWPYIVDQVFHWISIALVAAWIERAAPSATPFLPPRVVIFALGYLLVTYVWFVSERILAHAAPEYRKEVVCQLWQRMAARAAWFSVFLLLFGLLPGLLSSGAAAALVLPQPYSSGKYRWRALLTDVSVALFIALLVQAWLRGLAAG